MFCETEFHKQPTIQFRNYFVCLRQNNVCNDDLTTVKVSEIESRTQSKGCNNTHGGHSTMMSRGVECRGNLKLM